MDYLNSELKRLAKGSDMDYTVNKTNQFLQDCFGGTAKTCVISAVDPSSSSAKESMATMR